MALVAIAGIALALAASACSRPPGPRGWAAPHPVAGKDVTLVPYQRKLFALPKDSPNITWQFPPKDKSAYPVSEAARTELTSLLSPLGLDDARRSMLTARIDELKVEGSTVDTLRRAVDDTGADGKARNAYKSRANKIVADEKRALNGVRAFYGDLAVSSDGKTAFVPAYGGWLYALDVATGETRWIADLDPMVGGVLATDAAIYVGTKSEKLYALDPNSGAVTVSTRLDGEIWAAPTELDRGDILIPTLGGSVYRLNNKLETVWRFRGADAGLAAKAVVEGEMVYAGAWDNKLYAIDKATGEQRWTIDADNWFWSSPLVSGGVLFAASLDGKVYAVDATTGEARWPKPFDTGSEVRSSLAMSGGNLIVAARDGVLRKLLPSDGSQRGELQIGTRLEADIIAAQGGKEDIYAVPRQSILWVINTSDMSGTRYELPH